MEFIIKYNQVGKFEIAERLKSYRGLQQSEYINILVNFTSKGEQARTQDLVILTSEINVLTFINNSIKNNSDIEITSPSKLLSYKNGILTIITESKEDNIEFSSFKTSDPEIINEIIGLFLGIYNLSSA